MVNYKVNEINFEDVSDIENEINYYSSKGWMVVAISTYSKTEDDDDTTRAVLVFAKQFQENVSKGYIAPDIDLSIPDLPRF